jgi:hypothetical protein
MPLGTIAVPKPTPRLKEIAHGNLSIALTAKEATAALSIRDARFLFE